MSNFDENVVNKIKRLEREVERLKVNSEKALPDGWIPVSATWTYASATTITVPSGAASIYKVGQGIKLTQTTVKYFYIVTVADTLLTITGGSGYTLANAAISAISYTNTPGTAIGFPVWFAATAPTYDLTYADNGSGGQPTTTVCRFMIEGRKLTLKYNGGAYKVGTNNIFVLNFGSTLPLPMNETSYSCDGTALFGFINLPGGLAHSGAGVWYIFCSSPITDNTNIYAWGFAITYEI